MYKQALRLNNLQWLIYHKTKPNQTIITSGILISIAMIITTMTVIIIIIIIINIKIIIATMVIINIIKKIQSTCVLN